MKKNTEKNKGCNVAEQEEDANAQTAEEVSADTEGTAETKQQAEAQATEIVVEKVEEPPSAEELKELKEKASKAEEYWNKLLHLVADFDNFKKRAERKRQDDILSAKVAIVETFLPVLDNFEIAFSAAKDIQEPTVKSLQDGIEMVLSQFRNVLKECGVDTIEPQGEEFDHSYHEAVSEQETDEVAEGHVVQVLRKGYIMGPRLIRAARVIVARKASK
ncbi:MAG TPA: nucleotide exchange factor GrpE [Verrucomicrobiota bacterium]|nr:nucleotide exchange factor GrpE [Verrucomicrobiota bacterium]